MTVKLDVETQAFNFKGGMLPITVIELLSLDLEQIDHQLTRKINLSPAFFQQTPVVISLEKLHKPHLLVLDSVCEILRAHQLLPVAVRGGGERIKNLTLNLAIGWLPGRDNKIITVHDQDFPLKVKKPPSAVSNKIIRQTVRSGQQICALDGDLVVVGAVNAGAEILAAGSIHVYGPLRGRALAGIHGDQQVAIFCQELHAELLSIAGNYKRLEDISPLLLGKSVQVNLNNDQLEICPFTSI